MKTITIGLLLIVLAATPAVSRSDELPTPATGELSTAEPVFDKAASRVGYLSDVGRYEEAWALCDSLREAFPDQPAPYLYTASEYVNWMQSHRLSDYENEVDANVEQAIEAGTRLQKTSDDAWLSSHVGSAYGLRAMARVRRHNWIGDYMDGRRSIGHLRAALERDPQLYDLYFPIGQVSLLAHCAFILHPRGRVLDARSARTRLAADGTGRPPRPLHPAWRSAWDRAVAV